jgi:hypothetical protein
MNTRIDPVPAEQFINHYSASLSVVLDDQTGIEA